MVRIFAGSRRGSQIVEASLVYPLIIFISVMSIALMVYFYSCTETAAVMSMEIRKLAGESAGTVERSAAESSSDTSDSYDGYTVEEGRGLLYENFSASFSSDFDPSGIIDLSGHAETTIERSCVNEAKLIWMRQLVEDFLDVGDSEEAEK